MIPRTEMIYSWTYNNQLSKGYSFGAIARLKQKCSRFEKLWKRNEKKIFSCIQKFSGFRWEEKIIELYIVEKRLFGISRPLTISFNKDSRIMLVRAIHELCHRIMEKDVEFLDLGFCEACATLIARYVLAWLFGLKDLRMERYASKELKQEFKQLALVDLHRHPLRWWLEKYFSNRVFLR